MAAISSSSSSSSSHSTPYDVFLCFRGDDTRYGFTSHLMTALRDRQIQTFIDDKLEKQKSIDELKSIIKRCALSVVVFSEKFADSVSCLDEVAIIARKMKESGYRVLPVLYKVDPSNMTKDTGSYAATVDRKHESRSSYAEDKKRWMDALNVVADSAGHNSQTFKNESELIKAIVEDVLKKIIDMSPVIKNDNLVGMGSRIFEVERLLAMDKVDETRIVGLWGMGGVGKTTLARACYERIISSNKGTKHLFISDFNERYGTHHNVEEVVCKYYSKLLNEDNIDREDLNFTYRRGRLSRLRVFIVIDNVETSQQLEHLVLGGVSNLSTIFAAGSRILVTTRNREVLKNATREVYKVECLNEEKSTRLFSLHAFRQNYPEDNWKRKSRLATSYCKGNPLALKILGGALCRRDMHYWQSFLSGLKQIGKMDIHNVLRRSYDMLEEIEKKTFLDVACLFYDMLKSQLIKYMSTMYPASLVTVENLIDRSLLTCVSNEKIKVHDLLKEMAWNIVNGEPKLGKRSRIADLDDIRKLLRARDIHKLLTTLEVKNWSTTSFLDFFKGIVMVVLPKPKRRRIVDTHWKGKIPLEEHRTTEGIRLDLQTAKEMYLEADAFEGMNSLTFLKFHGNADKVHLPYGGLRSLPNQLRWLEWERYPSKSLPAKFCPQHLTHLIIVDSPIQRCWEGHDQPKLVILLVLNLSYCRNLILIPNISSSSKLEELLLIRCTSLVEVPCHVQYLTKLITLDLNDCRNLKRLPPRLDSKLLKHVRMRSCPNLTYFPEIISRELEKLNLFETSLIELPSAIYNVKQDGELLLHGENITEFPAVTTNLNIFSLTSTSIRDIGFYDRHTSSESIMPKVNILVLSGNLQLKSLPSSINNIRSLEGLYLSETGIQSLPELPPNLKILEVSGCKFLQALPTNTSELLHLKELHFDECPELANLLVHPILYASPKCEFVCSRSELPEWLTYKSMNLKEDDEDFSVKVELPPPNSTDQPMIVKGFAFGLLFSSRSRVFMRCDYKVGNTVIASLVCFDGYYTGSSSEKLWLQYEKMDVGSKEDEAWYVKYAGVTVSLNFSIFYGKAGKPKIKGCGVCLLY